jgi:enterochelin esterase-like enzyme
MSEIHTLESYADKSFKISSLHLNSKKPVDVYLPPSYLTSPFQRYKVLYVNDGQDMLSLKLRQNLDELYQKKLIEEIIVVAVRATERLQEYGTANSPDYANRGSKAPLYTKFVIEELIPFINKKYRTIIGKGSNTFTGFSLGGLSAFDITWNYPDFFGKVGVFSGSFWWRHHSENDLAANIDRIMHKVVRESQKKEDLKFWFQAGTLDETADRNNNGIIDAIDDILDLMTELEKVGYRKEVDMKYVQVEGGRHDFNTWSAILPEFLIWAFGKK